MKGKTPLAAVLLVAAIGCTLSRPQEPEIRRLVGDFVDSVNDSDVERFVAFFEEDATAFLPSGKNAMRRRGASEIRSAVTPAFATGKPEKPLVPRDVVVDAGDDFAVASFDVGTGALHSRRTLVLRRTAGVWRIVHLHASNVREE